MAKGAASSERWVSDVSELVADELRRRVQVLEQAGHDPSALGTAAETAARMLAALPEPSAWSALGPFFSTTGVCRVLGGVSRQAVDDRRRRHSLVALQTAEGSWVYPAFQFDGRNRPVPAVVAAHRRLTQAGIGAWSAASILLGPQPELGGRSIAEHLRAGGDAPAVDDLLDAAARAVA